ncbi:hypothetical protein OsI_24381 [Oryza sativa Indica Group]|uniref:Uncharacterized protein n=6 Tax=Oryza TaxID=4527 RepID=Q5Z808_ORYSJ|nr:hypothetical protein OsI_24381 [Oryza sativa Indica Group]EAZ38205.1 hypothetical protein OsJ_22558 [Oryza sativa Japonica Group]BAD54048.1 hypothetical protein [Oryza sativa Japonica Group]
MNGGGLARAAAPAVVALALAAILSTPPPQPETFSNIPQTLSGGDGKQQVRIKRPKSAKALQCTSKCVATCIRGGEGPLNASGSFQGTIPQPAVLSARMSAISSRMEKMGNEESFDKEKQQQFKPRQGMDSRMVTD